MNKILKNLFLILSFFILFFIILFNFRVNETTPIDVNKLEKFDDLQQARGIVNELKKKTSHIKSFSSDDISITLRRVNAFGRLHYKDKKIRLIVDSFLGKEIDIGANNEVFWFWSRRMRPLALYYCRHEDVYKTNLKPIFNRDWILDCFTFNSVEEPCDQVSFFKKEGYLVTKKLSRVSDSEFVFFVTVIDLDRILIESKYICDLNNRVLAYVEYREFDEISIPRVVVINWCEENIQMTWRINSFKINSTIDESTWNAPDYTPTVDMAE